ncbi:hypothetical protein [Rhizobium sp. PDO1-076]|uniref:hypothetical protein n=1 Tax=Rhizobium sp. PDO1-076 TaxID=1125979 RepID=UPI001FCC22F1|nr:hypothetical protein [Rhizobium sp. PDO1-076]
MTGAHSGKELYRLADMGMVAAVATDGVALAAVLDLRREVCFEAIGDHHSVPLLDRQARVMIGAFNGEEEL